MDTPQTPSPTKWNLLSMREREVALLLARGDTCREIAEALGLNQKTVDTHRGNVIRKLQCKNNVGLTRLLIREGRVLP